MHKRGSTSLLLWLAIDIGEMTQFFQNSGILQGKWYFISNFLYIFTEEKYVCECKILSQGPTKFTTEIKLVDISIIINNHKLDWIEILPPSIHFFF